MAIRPLDWYCRPVKNGVWSSAIVNALGAYTPCAVESIVVALSHLIVMGLCIYRIWLTTNNFKAKRFCLKSKLYNYMLGLLAAYCTAEPLFRLIMGISISNSDGQTSLAPFEIFSLIVEILAWCTVLVMIGLETRIYIFEFSWFVRFSLIYAVVGDAVMFNLVLPVRDLYDSPIWMVDEEMESKELLCYH